MRFLIQFSGFRMDYSFCVEVARKLEKWSADKRRLTNPVLRESF